MADGIELGAVERLLGNAAPGTPMSSTKSMTGHLLGAAGAVESILTILALHHRTAPPTINVTDLDPKIELDVTVNGTRELGRGVALNNSFGFGGHNVALAFRSV
jgi:3-oxoacyl-[acyl-carrier-protein] synthase II